MSTLITTTAQIGTIKDAGGNATAMTIDSTGRVLKSLMPYIYLRGNSASEVIQHGSAADYTNWNTETIQGGMAFNSSNGRITVPLNGIYQVAAKFYLWANNAAAQGVMIQKNSTTFQEYFTDFAAVGDGSRTDHTICINEILKLNANDYISFNCNADIYAGSNHTNCQMVMLG